MESSEFWEVAALNQRIRRVLSVFRTVASQMGAHAGKSGESALHLSGRIGAIGRAVLVPVSFGGMDLELLVRDELLQAAAPQQYVIGGPEVRLAPKPAELMSLVIHELATNAVKYGALCQPRAKISIMWKIGYDSGTRSLHFEWSESGVRMAGAPPAPGFGSLLIERLIARELKGEGKMAFLPDGVCCTIEIPLPDHAHRRE